MLEHRSYLVQRLNRPRGDSIAEVFAFGGGYKNGGLSDDAMSLLRQVWSFDYMGAAEFEWGAVPEALSRIAKAQLVAHTFEIPLAEVEKNWRDKSGAKPEGAATIFVLCPDGWQEEIERRVRAWAASTFHAEREFQLKEGTRLPAALRPVDEWDSETCGWLELDNGFLFFTDREMWEKACTLFGVVAGEVAAA